MNVLIRDVPDDVHAELLRRAGAAGQSLQQFLVGELERLTRRPTLSDVVDRIQHRSGGRVGFERAVELLAEERDLR